ncbi:MAG: DNA-binding protein [Rhodocyclales bacterium GT-UBC]|nr:MAG: DNA-binding protein [Rhodocyclales bacterium GT-UBC]
MTLNDNTQFISKHELCQHLRISVRTLENMVRDGSFPPPIRLGKHVYWTEKAVAAWKRRLVAAQEAWQSTI